MPVFVTSPLPICEVQGLLFKERKLSTTHPNGSLHSRQQQAHIINGDLIVRSCSAGILPEEIPSGKPVPLPPPTVPSRPPSPLNEMLLILVAASPAS